MKVNILGTEYKVIVKKYDEDEAFERRSIDGYCDGFTKTIVVCDMHTYKGWEYETEDTIKECQKLILRHEITHAFLNESGLQDSTFAYDCGWARNEEMVDWFAIQSPKILATFKEVGCI